MGVRYITIQNTGLTEDESFGMLPRRVADALVNLDIGWAILSSVHYGSEGYTDIYSAQTILQWKTCTVFRLRISMTQYKVGTSYYKYISYSIINPASGTALTNQPMHTESFSSLTQELKLSIAYNEDSCLIRQGSPTYRTPSLGFLLTIDVDDQTERYAAVGYDGGDTTTLTRFWMEWGEMYIKYMKIKVNGMPASYPNTLMRIPAYIAHDDMSRYTNIRIKDGYYCAPYIAIPQVYSINGINYAKVVDGAAGLTMKV